MDISQAERQTYAEIFASLGPINGYITGENRLSPSHRCLFLRVHNHSLMKRCSPLSSSTHTSVPTSPSAPLSLGVQARQMFMNSGLHMDKLAQIWYGAPVCNRYLPYHH
jgi:hypothetical protein